MPEIKHPDTPRPWKRPSPPVILHNTATGGGTTNNVDENGHIISYAPGQMTPNGAGPAGTSDPFSPVGNSGGGS